MTHTQMKSSLGGLLVRNTAWNLVGQAMPAFVALAALPVLTRTLGAERFGVLAIAWLLLTYLLDLGCGRATTRFVAQLIGAGQRRRVRAVTTIAVVAQAVLGILLGGLLALGAAAFVSGVLRVSAEHQAEATAAFVWLAAAVPFVLLAGAYRGVLEAAQRFDLVNAIRVPASAAAYLVPVVGVVLGWRLPGIVALLVVSRMLMAASYAWLAWRVVPETAGLAFERRELRAVVTFGGWLTVSTVVSPILVYAERLALGAAVSVEAVGYYAGAAEVMLRLLIVPASLIATLFPAFSALFGTGDRARIAALGYRAVKYLLLPLVAVVTLVVPFADALLGWWLGEAFAQAALAFQVLGVGVVLTAVGYVPSALLQAAGRADLTARFHLLELPVFGLLLVVLVPRYGITGAAVAWSARGLLDAALLYGAAVRLGLLDTAAAINERVARVGTAAGASLAAALVIGMVPDVAIRAVIVAACAPFAAWLVWRQLLTDADRALLGRVRRLATVRA
jgi:O-antigen/teichoic acid export membrane protein